MVSRATRVAGPLRKFLVALEDRHRRVRRRARRLANQSMVWLRYGTVRPDEIRLSDDRTVLRVDPNDERVYRLLVLESWRPYYSRLQSFWRTATRRYAPTSVVDVGVNAGECLFGTCYPPGATIVGFEANPRLQPLLRRNRLRHPDGRRITIVPGVASEDDSGTMRFYVDRAWSGKSSVVQGLATDPTEVEMVTVPKTTVDAVLLRTARSLDRLLFKIDVEGHEPAVLAGMQKTLDRARSALGFMEFDEAYLQRGGVDPAEFFGDLQRRFRVLAFVEHERLVDVSRCEIDALRAMVTDDPCHTDLVLVAGEAAERFGAWSAHWPACLGEDEPLSR